MNVWAIRHKPTGGWLPWRSGRGGSFDNPAVGKHPRLFPSRRSAQNCLSAWLQGEWWPRYHQSMEGTVYDGHAPRKVADREKGDMEIVEFSLVEVPV